MSKKVELHPAHIWTCDHCGRDQFERSIVAEFSKEEQEHYEQEIGEPFVCGNWLTMPERVICNYCGTSYETIDPHGEEQAND